MAPRETENNAYAKFWGDKQRTIMVRYGIFWGGQFRTRLLRLLLEMYGTANFNWSSEPREGLSVCGAYKLQRDHYTFLGNCPPTPPLSQHKHLLFTWGNNVGLGEG